MVSTRRGPQEQAAPEKAPSPSRKRTADGVPVGERRAEKKQQQLSIEATGVEQEEVPEAGGHDKHTQDGAAASGPRAELQETAGELLKLYACTRSFEYLSAILSRPNTRKGRQYKQLYEKFQRRRRGFRTRDNFIDGASLLEEEKEKNGSGKDTDTTDKVSLQRFARCINFVTFAASMLGSRDASFQQLNEHFFEVFIDRTGVRSGHLVKLQADILLGLKTQAYIAQAVEKGAVQEALLNELFPSDMTARLAALQPDPANAKLVQSEQTFVKQLIMRRRHLKNKDSPEAITATKDEYKWNDVLRNMLEYLRSHFEEIAQCPSDQIHSMNDDGENDEDVRVEVPVKTEPSSTATASARPAQQAAQVGTSADIIRPPSQQLQASASSSNSGTPALSVPRLSTDTNSTSTNPYVAAATAAAQAASAARNSAPTPANAQSNNSGLDAADELFKEAMQAATKALEQTPPSEMSYMSPQSLSNGSRPPAFGMTQTSPHIQQQFTNPLNSLSQASTSNRPPFSPSQRTAQDLQSPIQNRQGAPLAPNGQSHPTHQLYEMAREATTGRPTQQQPARRTGSQSQRRPWTQEEEKALLDGLDQVKGPHWSMILQLYGPGGKISEVLKDRNQVQLKDKARNLKLWFLKSGGEVPVNLKGVTGELKTRAPAAIKNQIAQQQQQAQSNGASSSNMQPGHAAMQQKPPMGFEAAHSSAYAPSGLYAPSAPANTVSGFSPSMPSDGLRNDAHGMAQGQSFAMGDPGAGLDAWTNAADDAAAQVIRDLGADFNFDPSEFADVKAEDDPIAAAAAAAVESSLKTEDQTTGMGADTSMQGGEQPAESEPSKEPDLLESILSGSGELSVNGMDVKAEDGIDLGPTEGITDISKGGNGDEMDAIAAAAAAAVAEAEAALGGEADLNDSTTTTANTTTV